MSFVALFVEDFCLFLVLCISLHVLTSLAIILLCVCVCVCVCVRVRVCVFIPLGFICWSVIVAVPGLRTCFCTDPTCVN